MPLKINTSGVLNNEKIIQISAGWAHSIALSDNGKIYAWLKFKKNLKILKKN
jgi:alpha-tubulin suppressor-like RCC1 family protein